MEKNKITKDDLITAIYEKSDVNKKDIAKIIDLFLEEVKIQLESDSVIELRGFGTFETRLRKEKKNARNPKTGESVHVDAHYKAVFRSGKDLTDKLWNLHK